HTAHQRRYDRLVQRRVPANQMPVSFRKSSGITGDTSWIILVRKSALEPFGTAIMHQVDDRRHVYVLDHIRERLVYPAPFELVRLRLDLMPRYAPANSLQTKLAAQIEVALPVFVVPHQFI